MAEGKPSNLEAELLDDDDESEDLWDSDKVFSHKIGFLFLFFP